MKRRRLAAELKALRGKQTLDAVMAGTGLHKSKISRIESAEVGVSSDDTRTLCEFYGASADLTRVLVDLARTAARRGWWVTREVSAELALYLELEADADRLSAFTMSVVLGRYQTESTADALIRATNPTATDEQVRQAVDVRLERQAKVPNLRTWWVMWEPVLMTPTGGREVARQQIERLITEARKPHNTFQVLPLQHGAVSSPECPFTYFELGDTGLPVVHAEYLTGSVYLESVAEVRKYETSFQHLVAAALDPTRSMERMHRAAEEMA